MSLTSLNDPMAGRVATNVFGVNLPTNLGESIQFDPVSSMVNVFAVSGQDGSTTRTNITVTAQFSDGSTQLVVVPIVIYQPLLTSARPDDFGDTTYSSTFSPRRRPSAPGLKLELLNSSRAIALPANGMMASLSGYLGYTPSSRRRFYLEFPPDAGVLYFARYRDALNPPTP